MNLILEKNVMYFYVVNITIYNKLTHEKFYLLKINHGDIIQIMLLGILNDLHIKWYWYKIEFE